MNRFSRIIYLLIAAAGIFPDSAFAQRLQIDATRFFGGKGTTQITCISYDANEKSIVFCGFADSLGTGDLVPKPAHLSATAFGSHLFVGKLDSNRNLLWVKMYGGTSEAGEEADALQLNISANGDIAVAGTTTSSDFDGLGNHSIPGKFDFWLLRLDRSGNKRWHRCYGGSLNDFMLDLKQTSDGGFIMIGSTDSPTSGDVPFRYLQSEMTYDFFIIKTDSLGNKQWARTIGGTGEERRADIYQIGGAYYVTASSSSRDHECDDPGWAGLPYGAGYYLIKLDSAGNYLWNKAYGGPTGDSYVSSVWDYRDSTLVLAGEPDSFGFHVPAPLHPVWGDTWILKLKLDGSVVWSKTMGDTSMVTNENQQIQLSLHGKGYIVCTHIRPYNQKLCPDYFGKYDLHLYLIDSSGNPISDKKMGGPENEFNAFVCPYQSGFIVTGLTASTMLNEGKLLNNRQSSGCAFMAFLDYWPLQASNIAALAAVDMNVYPNPANGEVYISLADPANGQLCLLAPDGRIIRKLATQKGKFRYQLPVGSLAAGNYMISWQGEGTGISRQIAIR